LVIRNFGRLPYPSFVEIATDGKINALIDWDFCGILKRRVGLCRG
jgi:hypothetical protein